MSKREIYDDVEVTDGVSPFMSVSRRDVIDTILCGGGVGIFVSVLYLLLNSFVFGAVLCRPQHAADCAQAPQYAMIVAAVIGAIAGLVSLARVRVYRPLFVVLFATVSMWAANLIVSHYSWYWMIVILAVLYAVSYLLFMWLARIRSFILAGVVGVVVLVIVRLVASS